MNYKRLQAFHTVATHGSYTKASQAMNISQPTLSDHIRALEEEYGVRLFRPRGRGIELTALGVRLLECTQRHAVIEQEMDGVLRAAGSLTTGRLMVGAPAPHNILPLLGHFSRQYPGIEVTLTLGNDRQLRRDLDEGRIDVAVQSEGSLRDKDHHALLKRSVHRAVVPVGDPWAHRKSVTMAELCSRPLILREEGSSTRAALEQALADRGIRPTRFMEIGSREGVREAVAAGFGVGIIADTELGHDDRLCAIRIRNASLAVSEYLVCKKEIQEDRIIAALYAVLATG